MLSVWNTATGRGRLASLVVVQDCHLFGPAHIPVMWERCRGRIAALVWNMAKMLKRHGQEVVLYGSAGTDASCDEFVEILGPLALPAEYRELGAIPV